MRTSLLLRAAAFAALALPSPRAAALHAQAVDPLTVPVVRSRPAPLLTRREVALTTLFTAASIGLMQVDPEIQRWIRAPRYQESDGLAARAEEVKYINEKTLFVAEALAWGTGRLAGQRALADVGLHAAEAVVVTTLSTTLVRVAIGRSRPFVTGHSDAFDYAPFEGTSSQAYRSLPSLHAASSFATAAVLTGETARRRPGAVKVVAPVSFAIATLPGLGRMYTDKHWASDVALGAVVGTVIGVATVRYHHERTDDRLDRWLLSVTSTPRTGAPALALRRRF